MKKYLILVLVGLLAIACQKSEIQPDPSTMPPGELIEVALDLQLDQPQAISRAQAQPTTCNQGAVEAEWSATPIQTPTSKAVDDKTVANVWVLQFDGTEAGSTLRRAHYVENYVAGSSISVLNAAPTANRVAIVANTFDATWGSAFEVGTATWATVSAATKAVTKQSDLLHTNQSTEYVPMSGSNTGTLVVAGKFSVSLSRTVARVTVKIRLGNDLKEPTAKVQLCNIPTTTNWLPDVETAVWPASPVVFNYSEQELTGMSTQYQTLTYWVPINRRGTVANTTGPTRVKNAPDDKATYLRVVAGLFTYTIHLGENFSTDYNIKGNWDYTYSLTLHTDPFGQDSRVSDGRNFGTLVLLPAEPVANTGGTVRVSTPSAAAGLAWKASLSNTKGFSVGEVTGIGPDASAVVTLSVNPTNVVYTSFFRATELNGKTSSIEIKQAPSSLTFDSPSATMPVDYTATSATFTVTGTNGLKLAFVKTSGDAAFTTPADLICNGTAQTVIVTMAANMGAARQATFSATVTNPGASGLDLTGITVKQTGSWVEIDQLKWAKGNLVADGANGCKIGAATDYGLYFNFGSLVGWKGGANGDGTGEGSPATEVQVKPADYNATSGNTWPAGYCQGGTGTGGANGYNLPATDVATTGIGDPCRYYLGAPWRTPTADEYVALDAAGRGGWVTSPANGRWLGTSPGTESSSVFFPATGNRSGFDGAFVQDSVNGNSFYWSSSAKNAAYSYNMYSASGYFTSRQDTQGLNGASVRCVSE